MNNLVSIISNPVTTNVQQYAKTHQVQNWSHRISANIGFDTASFDLLDTKYILEEFLYSGLGRDITRYSQDGNLTVWNGQIVEMTLVQPGLQSRISLREMFNRASVRYIPINTAANPPTESAETSTAVANDTISQAKYGIKQIVVRPAHIDRITATDAAQLANVVLQKCKEPVRSNTITNSNSEPRLTVECEGYFHTLGWRIYNQTASSGTDNADAIIDAVQTSVGEFIDATAITSNSPTQVQKYFNRDDTAFNIIQWIASLGDTSYNRWLAYVLEDRKLVYKQAFDITSITIDYIRRINDGRQEIWTPDHRLVPPWEVRPNTWMRISDIYSFEPLSTTLPADYQTTYIESVQWSEPDQLSLTGSTGDRAQVIMARAAAQGDSLL